MTIRPVSSHDNGLPVAGDLQVVHLMLEESFEDHFNSYRESFPEFVQRLREDPGHRWDHWWLAYVAVDGQDVPAGALVCSVLAADASGREGSYVEYIGVNRAARGRGVAKGLLHTVITRRGRAGTQPGRARGRRRLAHQRRPALRLDGLEDRLRHGLVVQGHPAGVGTGNGAGDRAEGQRMSTSATLAGRKAENSEWLDRAVRIGLIAYGVVHLMVGFLAVQLALGSGGKSASQKGALAELAEQPFGKVLVWAIAIGMFLLVVWRVLDAVFGHRRRRRRQAQGRVAPRRSRP